MLPMAARPALSAGGSEHRHDICQGRPRAVSSALLHGAHGALSGLDGSEGQCDPGWQAEITRTGRLRNRGDPVPSRGRKRRVARPTCERFEGGSSRPRCAPCRNLVRRLIAHAGLSFGLLRSEPAAVRFKAACRAAWRPGPADLAKRVRVPREGQEPCLAANPLRSPGRSRTLKRPSSAGSF